MSVLEEELKSLLGSNIFEEDIKKIKAQGIQGDKPHDVHHNISLSLDKLYVGASIKIRAEKKIPCRTCSSEKLRRTCAMCKGNGRAPTGWGACTNCQGTGITENPSVSCGNISCKDGQIRQEKFFTVKIPAGARHGEQIRLTGQGDVLLHKPDNVSDIVCTVQELPHATFRRCGYDLYLVKTIDLRQALCGSKFVVEHLDKRKLAVHAKPGLIIKPGEMKCLKKEGMPVINSKSGAKGDLIIIFSVSFPPGLSPTIAEQIEALMPPKKELDGEGKDLEECQLCPFDPKEQVYHVPFRQREAYEDSPAKGANGKQGQDKVPGCHQQ